ncbi:LamG domain-containing protein, partial [Planctomycetota bacterium]
RFYAQGAVNYGPSSSTGSLVGTVPVGDGYWHHAACVYKKPTRLPGGGGGETGSAYVALYVDGELDVSGPVNGKFGINLDSRVQIGGNQAWPSREFTGAIDDMRVYRNHALTGAEIKAMFEGGIEDDPPLVNAGLNTVVQPPAPYTIALETFVSDDGEPLDTSPKTIWAQLSGPGTVTFDPCVIDYGALPGWAVNEVIPFTTNLTFSEPGFYNVALVANDFIYKHVDDVWIWVQEVAGDKTIAYWRYETNDTDEDYRGVPGADDPNTLVVPNEIVGAPPLIATRNIDIEVPVLHSPAWSMYPTIPGYGDAANDSRLGEGPGQQFSWGERIGTSGMSITMYAEAWDGILFPEDGITVECMIGLDEQNWTIFDMETGRAGLRIFNASTGNWNNWSGIGEWDGIYVPVNTLEFEFWVETEIINEYRYNCLITDILVYQMGWMHIAFTYDKATGIARVYKDGIPAWLTHWFNPERQSNTTTNPKGFTEFNPIVDHYDGVPGRSFSLPEELDLSVSTDVDTIPSYFDELRITAEALFPPKFLIVGPKMCETKIQGDMDGDCDVDIYDLYLFGQTWLECNNADLNQCFK